MDKVLLVTGATSEIGIELIRNVYREYKVIYAHYCHMNDKFMELLKYLEGKVQILPIQADFSSEKSVMEFIEKISETGNVPNNIVHLPAPKVYNKQFHKDSWLNYDLGWEISVHSIVSILQAFLPAMVKQRYGRLVFMLTSNTINNPAKYQAAYVTTKYALLGLMKALSVEYADKGVTVNGISPDMMETKFLSELPRLIVEQNSANSPIGRNIYVEEIIPIMQYMLSDGGAAMTGQNIGITGGF